MCDIWKGNKNIKQLSEEDVQGLLQSLVKFRTKQVLMSGGEALLNPLFFQFCEILRKEKIKIVLLSTGLLLKRHADLLVKYVDEIIVSIDGDESLHDSIRNIPGAFHQLKEGIAALKKINPGFRITARTVIHQLNFKAWPSIIDAARNIGINKISFLAADVSSTAFNREIIWGKDRKNEIMIQVNQLGELGNVIHCLLSNYKIDFEKGFIAESPEKIKKIYTYYAALNGLCDFPYKKCNAPWVSTVIEADGNVRPCFFYPVIGNIRGASLHKILNHQSVVSFRKTLNTYDNDICKKCVCSLYLPPYQSV
jgi:MoaA/NifB/PqqE/SkfB family radical SAM enzyme